MLEAEFCRRNAARIDQLAADWTLGQQARKAAAETDVADFCERAQSLFNGVSGILWRDTSWNLFELLGRTWSEDDHTRVIAWLMKPTAPHGLQDAFLKAFFKRAFDTDAPAGTVECRVAVRKRIPRGEVDIEVKGPGWWLIVENKIDCEEDQGQTKKYADHYEKFAKLGKSFFPVFLSREGKRPESRDFAPMSYRALREVVEEVVEKVRPAPEAEQLVRHLVQHILCEVEI